ncbi:YadA-like family protein [Burkholderia latens]|nr:YadA-like family protein [Burkholderia latens]
MNKTYRVVWNASTNTWCAASEIAHGRTKSSSGKVQVKVALALIAASSGQAFATPSEESLQFPTEETATAEEEKSVMSTPIAGVGTRSVAADNKAYIKIDAIGDGTDAASALGEKSIAIGSNASARPSSTGLGGAVAVGGNAAATANNVAVGASASANGEQGAIAVGALANASGKSSIAVGNEAKAAGWGAYAMGRKAQATAESSLALGDSTVASAVGAIAHGLQASATAENAVALGMSASALGADSVALGSYSESDRDQTVSVGTVGFERQIVNVGRGTLDTDAANISQLKGVTDALGGGAGIGTDGSVKAPVYTVDGKQYANVGDALAAAAASGGGAGGNAVVYDGETKDKVTLAGGKTGTTLSNVKAGTLDTDAVNVSQLKSSGLVGEDGKSLSAVVYDGATKDKVTLAGGTTGTTITNVKAATLTSTSKDAVNGAQLFATNASLGALEESLKGGGVIDETTGESLAVAYDGTTKAKVTLAGGKTGTTITNVKAGTLTSTSKDAVNGAQLFATNESLGALEESLKSGGAIDETTGESLAVVYDGTTKAKVTLAGGKTGTTLSNVKAGTLDMDAVNVSQLKSSGLIGEDGKSLSAVAYDKKDDGSTNFASVTLGGVGAKVPTALHNVAKGVATTDAVNVSQLKGVTDALGGGAGIGEDGSVTKPSYKVGDKTYNDVGAALQAANAGGNAGNAVQYDSDTKKTVTLGGTASTSPVSLKNLAQGVADTDAVNVQQLSKGLNDIKDEISSGLSDGTLPMKYIQVKASGMKANALGANSVAIGGNANATVDNAVAIGSGARARAFNSVALGINSVADQENTVSIGDTGSITRRIVNVSDGIDENDAVNMKQLADAIGALDTKTQRSVGKRMMQRNVESTPGSFVAVDGIGKDGDYPSVASLNGATSGTAMAAGVSSVAAGRDALAVGVQAVAGSDNSVALGSGAQTGADQPYAVAVGSGVTTNGAETVAVGSNAKANANRAVALGNNRVWALGQSSVAIGDGAKAQAGAVNGIAVGTGASVAVNIVDAMALGAGASATAAGGVALGSGAVANRGNALSVGSGTVQRQIINVAKGTASTDAVNVSQLKGVTDALGGGAAIGTDGSVKAPVYTVDGKEYANVGDALEAAAASGGGTSENAVVYDGATKDKVTLAGKTGTTLANVKAGTLDTDAVNVSQLKSSGLIGEDGKSLSAVVYDGATKDKVTLAGGKTGTTLSNVKAGTLDMDAVNVSQLKSSGLIGEDGKSLSAVVYDKKDDGSTNFASVTLGGAGAKVPTVLHNVAKGVATTDAVNVSQLKGVTDALGGGAAIGTDGSVKAPVYTVDGKEYANVGDALEAAAASGGGTSENAVVYDGTTKDKVTLSGGKTGTTLSNVKAGTLDTDAVNVSQLKSSGLIGEDGKSLSAVVYDGATKDKVTLAGGTTGTTITNVKAGALTSTSKDAVNGAQLFATNESLGALEESLKDGGVIDGTTGESLAVVYDGTTKDKVTLAGGKTGTTLSNVKAGTLDMDAVNVSQLKSSGLIGEDGKSLSAVVYDKKDDGSTNFASVTLGGAGAKVPTVLHNVAKGVATTDAVNVSQLKGVTDALGGGAAIGADGGVKAPVYTVDGKEYANVGDALEAAAASGGGTSENAVVYDGATKDKVTLAGKTGTTLSNVKAGTLDTDAVNVSQLKSSGLIGEDGKSLSAVVYDGATKDKVTLAGGTTGTTITNVKAGALTSTSKDAVNGAQLFATNESLGALEESLKDGGVIDGTTGESLAVVYDGTTKDKVTLAGGKTGTTLSNVKAGTLDMDAVNVSQLKSSGLIGEDGKSLSAVVYDKKDDGSTNFASVTLGGAGAKVPTALHNVAKGVATTDAVNVSQLKGVTDALGGGAAIGADGGVKAPVYTVDGKEYANVGDALEAAAASGGGTSENAVVYDGATKDKVTLAGKTGTTLSNVKAGTLDTDAVNVSQLKSSGLIGEDGKSLSAVVYDGATKDKVTLAGGTTGTTITNVKAGALTSTSKDAVNGAQLFATNESLGALEESLKDGGVIDGTTGESLAVVYDGATKDKVTLAGGKTGTTLSNVKAGTLDMDAVNVSQLKSSGLIGDDGKSLSAVVYDKKDDGSTNFASVTLGGAGAKVPTALHNVAKGVATTDAVNVSQLKGVTDALGGGAAIGTDGSVKAPVYTVDGKEYANVGDALEAAAASGGGTSENAVVYDGTTKDKVTLAGGKTGTTLSNVKAGTLDTDAVNVSQLKSSGLIGEDGKSLSAVVYDGATKDKVTLAGGKTGTTITNVKAGALSSTSNDAVNGAQLFATNESLGALEESLKDGGVIDGTTGESLAVVYDGTTKDKVTLAGGKTGTTLSNVKAGTLDMDAVNVSQLKSSGLIGEDGKSLSAVVYDGATKDKVTLAGGKTGTTLSNVKAGTLDMDAVNVSQLKSSGLIGEDGKSLSAVVYDSATKDKVTLAGGKTGTTLSNVKAGTLDTDAVNVSQLKSSGLIGEDGKSLSAVVYDKKDDGSTNFASVTLGGAGAKVPTVLHNVAKGVASTDAVNVSQLKGVTDALGGGAGIGTDGSVKAPVYTVDGKEYANVGDALEAAAASGGGTSENAVVYDGTTKDKVTLAGGKTGTTITNVKAGALSSTSNDAVNGAQLFATNESLGALEESLKDGGVIDGTTGESLAVVYDGATKDKVTLSGGKTGTTLSNVKAGTLDMDAVNVSQLKSSGLIGEDGKSLSAVVYDGTTKDKVTLAGGKTGTTLSNVKAGTLDMDAVNVSQLKSSGLIGEDGKSLSAVVYDGATKDKVTLAGGKTGTTLSNVKAGTLDMDAVNVSQLKSSGLIGEDGKSLSAVVYDKKDDGSTNFASVTLGGAGAKVPTVLHNVAKGVASTDAVNVSQLKGVTDALGGGAGIGTDGGVKAPVYTVDGKEYANVGDALEAAAASGGGTSENAVVYDGTTKDKVTLAGKAGTLINNVANGSLTADSSDAVNGAQLNAVAKSVSEHFGAGAALDTATGKITAPSYTLAGANGGTETYHNVGDALENLDGRTSENTNQIDSLQRSLANAVQYDDETHAEVTFGGKGAAAPVTLKNVADGADDTDAVNVRQLKSAGLIGGDGTLLAAVTYDKHDDGTTNYSSVTLGGADATAPVTLHNVAKGVASTDAVNVSQLTGVTTALGGGAKLDPQTGEIVAPTYEVGGNTYHNVGDAFTDIDNRVTNIQNNLGESVNLAGVVAYDKHPDGTPNFGSLTLGNGVVSGPVTLTNVADGKSQYDAVNYGQLSALQGQVDEIHDRVIAAEVPGGSGAAVGNGLIDGTGGKGDTAGDVVAPKPGTGNANVSAGSNSQVANGVNDGTAVGAHASVKSNGGTAIGQGATVSAGASNAVAIGQGSVANEANTVSIGSDGHTRRLVNVADGVKATDAVSKGQFDRAMGGMQGQIDGMARNAYSGVAAATALTMIPGVDPGKNLSFGIGAASYKGYQAVAMGGEARITENLKMKAGVSLSSGGNVVGAGASYQW